MANTSDGDKGDPPYSSDANINTNPTSPLTTEVHSAKNDSIPTDIDQDSPYNSNHDADFEFYDNADGIDDTTTPDSMDMHVAPGTTSHPLPVACNTDTSPGADTAIHTANNNIANTDDSDDNDEDHMPDIETNHNKATGTIPSPTNAANRLLYSTDSEWKRSPWSTVSYNKTRH